MDGTVLSQVAGPTTPPLIEKTIGAALEDAAAAFGDGLALHSAHQGISLSYRELLTRSDDLAAGLLAHGLKPGDRIGIWAPNCAEWSLTQFAAARIGAILVTINPAYRLSEIEYTLKKVGVKALIAAERYKTSDYARMIETLAPEIARAQPGTLFAQRLPDLKIAIVIGGAARAGWLNFEAVCATGKAAGHEAVRTIGKNLAPGDAINIQFTSGTTGLPKGATLSHRNILNNAYFVGRSIGLKAGDRLCIPVPLYHCFGMVMGNLGCLTHGAAMIYPAATFEPEAVLKTIEDQKCTGLYGVPTMFIAMLGLQQFADYDLSSLRTGCMAGSPCPIEVMKAVIAKMHMRDVTIAYGMTETSPVSFQSGADDPVARRVSTIGRVQPHIEVKIVDGDGNTVPRGECGEICTRGYSVMLGYWNDPEQTKAAIDAEGWMHTGDIGTIDADGYGNVVGRIKDMVIRGGENLYPREIEEFLHTHPKIADVQIVGVPDPRYGEELCAWIRLMPDVQCDAEEIRAFCEMRIARHKIPRHIRFVTDYPMTVTGKVQKFLIREEMMRELGLTAEKTA
jgi:fatty-acyl-CoA synthase